MPNGVSADRRFRASHPCPICGGHDGLPRGHQQRCMGFLSSDGGYAHCSREEHAGPLRLEDGANTYPHRLTDNCKCGVRHDPNPPPAASNGHKAPKPASDPRIVETYVYVDAAGKLRYQVVRYENPKRFKQRQPDPFKEWVWTLSSVKPLIYRLPEVLKAIEAKLTICLAEGEKDVEALRRYGYTASCNSGGAEKWGTTQSEFLKGATDVVLFGDNDDAGRRHLAKQAQSLGKIGITPRIAQMDGLPEGGDVRDWLKTHTKEDLDQVIREAILAPTADEPLPDADEHQGWILGARGLPVSCQHNALKWLTAQEYDRQIALDTFKQSILVKDTPFTDDTTIEMVRLMEESEKICWAQTHVHSAIISLGNRHARSSLTDWLDSLTWDGKNRIWKFFTLTYGAEDSEYSVTCGQVLFLSAVARAYKPGCKADVCDTLIGNQGVGKSRGIEDLVPDQSWYTDDLGGDLSDKKAGEGLIGKWLIEFAEFERINRSTIEGVKAFLSRRVDHYRPPYGKTARDFPRQCIFIGTTNNPAPLQDLENRRFMPIVCQGLQTDIAAQRDQLWAEAVYRYKAGESWWVTDEKLLPIVKAHQEEARQHDEWEEILREALTPTIKKLTLLEAASYVRLLAEDLDKSRQTRLGLALKAIGFVRKRETSGARL